MGQMAGAAEYDILQTTRADRSRVRRPERVYSLNHLCEEKQISPEEQKLAELVY